MYVYAPIQCGDGQSDGQIGVAICIGMYIEKTAKSAKMSRKCLQYKGKVIAKMTGGLRKRL
jgi:hypothetical protein